MTPKRQRRERLEDKLRRLRELPPERTPKRVSPPFIPTQHATESDQT